MATPSFRGFTRPVKSLSFQEVFKSEEITKATGCKKHVKGIGSNENNLYLHKVLNKKVLNDFAMVKKKAFYITPPFEQHGRVTSPSHQAEVAKDKKNLLEKFTMKKREAFYITPPFDYDKTPGPETDVPEESSDSGSEREIQDQESEEKPDSLQAMDKHDDKSISDIQEKPRASKDKQKKPKPDKDAQDLKKSVPKIANDSVVSNNTDKVAAKSYDYDITFNPLANQFVTPHIARNKDGDADQKAIDDLTRKQADIIKELNEKGANKTEVDDYNRKFDDLVRSLQNQKAWASSTVLIMLDETEVKNKLRADPFVQRVLKMAQRRKAEYFRRAKEDALKKNLISK